MRNVVQTMLIVAALTVVAVSSLAAGGAPPLTNASGATLESLAGTSTLVTVTFKENPASDKNLRVVELGPDYVAFVTQDNQRVVYLCSAIKEIQVQDGKIDTKKFALEESRSLKMEEQQVLERAFDTARRVYDSASANQALKMQAAVLLALNTNKEAEEYLQKLVASNDLETQLDAAFYLYLAGKTEVDKALIAKGLQSGNRKIKAKAMDLAGLYNNSDSVPVLMNLFRDRLSDICSPAARALGRMQQAEVAPALVEMLGDRSEEKASAAAFALKKLGDPSLCPKIKEKLEQSKGTARHRIVLLLHALKDPSAAALLNEEVKSVPTLAGDAAIVLTRDGDWNAAQFLTEKLKRRYDEVTDEDRKSLSSEAIRLREMAVVFRARAAAALVQAGDATAVSYLQEMLRGEDMVLRREVCDLLGELGKRKLITILQSSLELNTQAAQSAGVSASQDDTALAAATAVVAIAKPDFRKRLYESRD